MTTSPAPTIHIVDAPGECFGTVRLDGPDHQNAHLEAFHPFGDPERP